MSRQASTASSGAIAATRAAAWSAAALAARSSSVSRGSFIATPNPA
jgi:hypothetical protein